MKNKPESGKKIICLNRKTSFNYFFYEIIEAGIALKGSEVKSLRDGKGSIADSYAVDKNGEFFLINSHIPLYRQSSYNNHNPKGERKLLLNRKEINKLVGKINQDGLTVIPTKMYFLKGKAKIELAVAKGKKLYDKRQVKKTRDWNREKSRLLSKNNK
jgi:SsrA-binding protein